MQIFTNKIPLGILNKKVFEFNLFLFCGYDTVYCIDFNYFINDFKFYYKEMRLLILYLNDLLNIILSIINNEKRE